MIKKLLLQPNTEVKFWFFLSIGNIFFYFPINLALVNAVFTHTGISLIINRGLFDKVKSYYTFVPHIFVLILYCICPSQFNWKFFISSYISIKCLNLKYKSLITIFQYLNFNRFPPRKSSLYWIYILNFRALDFHCVFQCIDSLLKFPVLLNFILCRHVEINAALICTKQLYFVILNLNKSIILLKYLITEYKVQKLKQIASENWSFRFISPLLLLL